MKNYGGKMDRKAFNKKRRKERVQRKSRKQNRRL